MISRRQYRFIFNGLLLVTFVGIGGLQMFGISGGLITNYGADLLAPPLIYLGFREGYRGRESGRVWGLGPWASLVCVLGGCAIWEWSQRFDFSGTPLAIASGTFDPLDLVAYAFGVLVCYYVDIRWLRPHHILPGAA